MRCSYPVECQTNGPILYKQSQTGKPLELMAGYREAGVYGASLTEVSAAGSGPSMAGFITVMKSTL